MRLLEQGGIKLFVSEQVLSEIKNVLSRPIVREKNRHITNITQNPLLRKLSQRAVKIENAPDEFKYERDPKDAKYINLALVTRAEYLVTLDWDLLDLMTKDDEMGERFRVKYPFLKILSPVAFLALFEQPSVL